MTVAGLGEQGRSGGSLPAKKRGARWRVPHTAALMRGPLRDTSRANDQPYRGPVASVDSGSSPPAGPCHNGKAGEAFEPGGFAAASAATLIMSPTPGALIA
jgi:hypothetical protein